MIGNWDTHHPPTSRAGRRLTATRRKGELDPDGEKRTIRISAGRAIWRNAAARRVIAFRTRHPAGNWHIPGVRRPMEGRGAIARALSRAKGVGKRPFHFIPRRRTPSGPANRAGHFPASGNKGIICLIRGGFIDLDGARSFL